MKRASNRHDWQLESDHRSHLGRAWVCSKCGWRHYSVYKPQDNAKLPADILDPGCEKLSCSDITLHKIMNS